jgi:hypothetical protein
LEKNFHQMVGTAQPQCKKTLQKTSKKASQKTSMSAAVKTWAKNGDSAGLPDFS